MSRWIIVPEADKNAMESRRFAPAAKTDRESRLDVKLCERWALKAIALKDGRWAIPADVLDHPAYAAAVEQLGKYTVEELDDKAFPVPDVPVP